MSQTHEVHERWILKTELLWAFGVGIFIAAALSMILFTALTISVNLSPKQFAEPNLIQQIERVLEETRLDPCTLQLEITESVVVENVEAVSEMLRQLRMLGVGLSIDDFGTGYSSLSSLHRFPISTLKIDSGKASGDTESSRRNVRPVLKRYPAGSR